MSYRYPTQSEHLSAENLPKSVEPPLKPMARTEEEPREFRIADVSSFQFADHQGFERWLDLSGIVNSRSKVFVSISEIGLFFGEWKPFMGAASCDIHNVVPQDDGIVIVRGVIGWDQDINVRLSVLVA